MIFNNPLSLSSHIFLFFCFHLIISLTNPENTNPHVEIWQRCIGFCSTKSFIDLHNFN